MHDTILTVEHLRQYFNKGSFHAVDDISFSIHKGEVLGLVGESGSGKTTTGRAIIKLYDITGGNIFFKGERISAGLWDYTQEIAHIKTDFAQKRISVAEKNERIRTQKSLIKEAKRTNKQTGFQTKIQMIFQDPVSSLNPRMTVQEIIAEGLVIQGIKHKADLSQKVSNALRLVGLRPEYADRYPHEFSGGQRQRIGIARALIMEPELIIADEPISALDVSIKAQIINLLDDVRHKLGLTILFIAHDLSVVKYFCDRIAVMYAGKIVETAPSEELFLHPLHPYTKSLLSAIPLPDPYYEKQRTRLVYTPPPASTVAAALVQEIVPGHFVLCSYQEAEAYRVERGR